MDILLQILALIAIGLVAFSFVYGFWKSYNAYYKGRHTRFYIFGKLIKEWNAPQPVEESNDSEQLDVDNADQVTDLVKE